MNELDELETMLNQIKIINGEIGEVKEKEKIELCKDLQKDIECNIRELKTGEEIKKIIGEEKSRRNTMINKKEVKKIIQKKLKDNPNYLSEQIEAYDREFALQKTFSIQFFPEDKLDVVEEVRDYLYELYKKQEKQNE